MNAKKNIERHWKTLLFFGAMMQVGLLVKRNCVIILFGTSNHCVPLKQDVHLHTLSTNIYPRCPRGWSASQDGVFSPFDISRWLLLLGTRKAGLTTGSFGSIIRLTSSTDPSILITQHVCWWCKIGWMPTLSIRERGNGVYVLFISMHWR